MGLLGTAAVGVAATVLGGTMAGAPAAATALTVEGQCRAVYGIGQWRDFHCTASASGGAGNYQYTWKVIMPFTVLLVDEGPAAEGYCSAYSDSRVRVTVVSGTETAQTDIGFPCV